MERTIDEIGVQMNRPTMWVVGLVAGAIVLAACSGSTGGSAPTTAPDVTTTSTSEDGGGISIEGFAFGPDDLSISVGETVTWTNNETGVPHTVVSDDGVWQSDTLSPGDSFSFTFDQPGTYTYFCSIHPSMTATITVDG